MQAKIQQSQMYSKLFIPLFRNKAAQNIVLTTLYSKYTHVLLKMYIHAHTQILYTRSEVC